MNEIYDYAVIGDCRSAALVSRQGSIEWLCWPHFDSPSIFGAILDERAGRWSVAPAGSFAVDRHYEHDTNVLVTRFRGDSGTLRVTDFMPVASEQEKEALLFPEHEILRLIECEEGEAEVEMVFEPKPDYGRGSVRVRDGGKLGVRVHTGVGLLTLRTDFPVVLHSGGGRSRFRLRAGESRHASLTYTEEWLAVLPPLGPWSRDCLRRSVSWWREWISRMRYGGPWRDAIARSVLALKLLVFSPSGAVVAAPSTSLPERIGGDLNWDYRFCWLRDASLTLRGLFGLGYHSEGEAFLSWLLHSTRLSRPELHVLYDVYGKAPQREETLDHLSGHRGSRPVRIGNAAVEQLQLDIYGEIVDAAARFVWQGGTLDRETKRLLCELGDFVCRNWSRPDDGIWEPRVQRRHHTHSRVLCWAALDRLVQLHRKGHLRARHIELFTRTRELIRQDVEERGWSAKHQSYVAILGGEEVDAALLLLPWYEFSAAEADRMRSTWARIERELGAGEGLLWRYRSSLSPGEGAFGICSFWAAEYLALAGRVPEAMARVETMLRYRNDVGLYAEEIDPTTGRGLGNFPQAFTHVGLVNAALTVERRLEVARG
jgi:GH15 family glucan-1,4-alpha-glucosidase